MAEGLPMGCRAPASRGHGPRHCRPALPCLTLQGYEPYVIMHRDYVPWYDERFRGFGFDKIVHTALMHCKRPCLPAWLPACVAGGRRQAGGLPSTRGEWRQPAAESSAAPWARACCRPGHPVLRRPWKLCRPHAPQEGCLLEARQGLWQIRGGQASMLRAAAAAAAGSRVGACSAWARVAGQHRVGCALQRADPALQMHKLWDQVQAEMRQRTYQPTTSFADGSSRALP